jgi:pyruvate/2-oxoglutarate dehydrogenase complex dihydrolipoamide acyltransferase (E2) component
MLVLAAAMAALLAVNYGDRVAALLPDGLLPGAAPAEAAAAATVAPAPSPAPPAAPAAAPVADRILAHLGEARDAVAGALAPALAQIRAGLAGVDAAGAQAWLADRAAAARAGDLQAIGALGALAGAGLGVLLLAWFFAALLRALRPPRPPRRRAIRA